MSRPYKITFIFICVITAICLIFEIIGIASKDVDTLSPVLQDIFYRVPAITVAVGYLMGHFIIRLKYKLKLWISLLVLACLACVAQVFVYIVPVEPIIWFVIAFITGIFVWNQGRAESELKI